MVVIHEAHGGTLLRCVCALGGGGGNAVLLAGDDTRFFSKRVGKHSATFFNEYSWTTAVSTVQLTQGHLLFLYFHSSDFEH